MFPSVDSKRLKERRIDPYLDHAVLLSKMPTRRTVYDSNYRYFATAFYHSSDAVIRLATVAQRA